MKTQKEIEKELENVEFHLQSTIFDDWRVHFWEAYRDALQWVLDIESSKMKWVECQNQSGSINRYQLNFFDKID